MFELLCYVTTDGYIAKSDCFSWSRRRPYIGLLASFRIRWFSIIVHFFTHVVKLFYEVSLWSCILNLNRKNRQSHTTEFSARNGFHCNDYRTLAVDWVCWLLYFMLSSKWKKNASSILFVYVMTALRCIGSDAYFQLKVFSDSRVHVWRANSQDRCIYGIMYWIWPEFDQYNWM